MWFVVITIIRTGLLLTVMNFIRDGIEKLKQEGQTAQGHWKIKCSMILCVVILILSVIDLIATIIS